MSHPQRIRLSRARGFCLPDNAVVVARPDKLGNCFIVGKHGTRAQCAAMFFQLACGFIDLGSDIDPEDQLKLHTAIKRALPSLEGKDLACWCALDGGACHADVLLYLANAGIPIPAWAKDGVVLGRPRIGIDPRDYATLKRAAARKKQAAQ